MDTAKWSFENNCSGGGNNELQCYTSAAENALVKDGYLNIAALKNPTQGPAKHDDEVGYNPSDLSAKRDYSSARLRSKNKGDWRYGRMDIRAKLPQGQGIWPAIWMLPTNSVYGAWPLSGEIDILEAVNTNAAGGNFIYGTLHYGNPWPDNKHIGTSYAPSTPIWQEFHTYSVEWEAGEIRWYVDNHHYATQVQSGWYTAASSKPGAPFDQVFHMILNLAVGGEWPGNPNVQTQFPQTMQVDYVRVYRCPLDVINGVGCASFVDPAIIPLNGTPAPVTPSTRNNYAMPPLFTVFNDGLASGLRYDSYNPDNAIAFNELADAQRGKILNIVKTGNNGNVFFNLIDGPVDLRSWADGGQLTMDIKVNSLGASNKLLVKLDSGWPNTSDITVTLPANGQWGEVRVSIAELIAHGNSLAAGAANLASISNLLVLEPTGPLDVTVDNIRLIKP